MGNEINGTYYVLTGICVHAKPTTKVFGPALTNITNIREQHL